MGSTHCSGSMPPKWAKFSRRVFSLNRIWASALICCRLQPPHRSANSQGGCWRSGAVSNTSRVRSSSNLLRVLTTLAITVSPGRAPSTNCTLPSVRAMPRPSWPRDSISQRTGSCGRTLRRRLLILAGLLKINDSGAREYTGRQVTVSAVTDNGHDHRVFNLARQLERSRNGPARRHTTEDAFFTGQGPHGVFCFLLADVQHLVYPGGIVDFWQIGFRPAPDRSEEHTSELQSRPHLVCRLLLEKKKRTEV